MQGEWRVKAHHIQLLWALIPTECHFYIQIKKEALVFTWACENMADFLLDLHFNIQTDHKSCLAPKRAWMSYYYGSSGSDCVFIHHQLCSREELDCGRRSISRWTNNLNHSWHRLQTGGLFSPLEHSQPHPCYRKLVATDKTTPGTGRGVQATHSVLSYSAVREPQAKG